MIHTPIHILSVLVNHYNIGSAFFAIITTISLSTTQNACDCNITATGSLQGSLQDDGLRLADTLFSISWAIRRSVWFAPMLCREIHLIEGALIQLRNPQFSSAGISRTAAYAFSSCRICFTSAAAIFSWVCTWGCAMAPRGSSELMRMYLSVLILLSPLSLRYSSTACRITS